MNRQGFAATGLPSGRVYWLRPGRAVRENRPTRPSAQSLPQSAKAALPCTVPAATESATAPFFTRISFLRFSNPISIRRELRAP
ncbi:hypothetical protein WQQ_29740 [Hydrocarboniphaga effusa AP103]|uniref:Uncharacterized protein n=1 Tax=Hydrocarboniphaga effusa AP103 TaxID=1172194 RepID=I7ZCI7_9GAMM|nr:hypothetical protein WQQ_29740 [Hydrocarboniphaga effusa AP103]